MSLFGPNITDIHTHRTDARDAIISIGPDDDMRDGLYYSVGIHPWDTSLYADPVRRADAMSRLERMARDPRVLAIGEAGMDTLRGGDLDMQQNLFESQALLAERVGKPMILHIVRAYDRLIASRRRLSPAQPWIIHGFRGGPEQARQLLAHGLHLSLGTRYNPDTLAVIPPDRLHRETDSPDTTIDN